MVLGHDPTIDAYVDAINGQQRLGLLDGSRGPGPGRKYSRYHIEAFLKQRGF
jgi:hypothetical protein